MCRIPKVIVVAPESKHLDLRRALSSLEYDVVATVEDAADIAGDVAVVWEPDDALVGDLRERGLKVVAVGGAADDADMQIDPDDIASFRTRIWELFRPS